MKTQSKFIIVQSFKDLVINGVQENADVRCWFFLICQLSPLNMCENQKYWYIHDLLDEIGNHTFNLIQ